MKRIMLTLLIVGTMSGVFSPVPASRAWAGGPHWVPYARGLEAGKAEGKNILVHFYSNNCKYCHLMENETYADQEVASFLEQNFISIKVDGNVAQDLSAAFAVRGYPTIWFLEPGGEKIAPLPGYIPAPEFLTVLKYVRGKVYDQMTFEEYVEKNSSRKQ